MNRAPNRRRRLERGAAAVEFALVSVILIPILLGIIDYGLWFNDSVNARQGVREAARRAVVKTFPTTGACASGTDFAKINCLTKQEINSVSGPTYVKLVTPNNWVKGRPLLVCAMVKVNGASGLVPIPNDRLIRAKTQMSIENATVVPTGTVAAASDAAPAGANWNWCTS